MRAADTRSEHISRRTYRYRLYPTRLQRESLDEQRRFCCALYNAGLEQRRDAWRRQRKSVGYVTQATDLTELRKASMTPAGMNCWTQQHALRRLDLAFAAFFRRRKAGENPGFPRFRSDHRYDSLTWSFSGNAGGCAISNGRLALQGIGAVKLKWHRSLPEDATLRTVTVVRSGEHWYACFSLDIPRVASEPADLPSVGIDLGITTFAALSNDERIEGPRAGRAAQRKLKMAQQRLSRRKRGSKRRIKARRQVAKAHARIANIRRDHAHQTARRLVSRFGLIAVEKLNVAGLAGGMLARDVNDQGWGQFLTILESKAVEAGSRVVAVDPRGTSQTCPECDAPVPKTLSDRWHSCACGYEANRDVASARCILSRAFDSRPGSSRQPTPEPSEVV